MIEIQMPDSFNDDKPHGATAPIETKVVKMNIPDDIELVIQNLLHEIRRESGMHSHQIANDFIIYMPSYASEAMRRQVFNKHHYDMPTIATEYEGLTIMRGYEEKIVIAHRDHLVLKKHWMYKELKF